MTDNENRIWLYKKLKGAGYNLGEYDEFSNALSDDNNKRWLYDKAQAAHLNVGTFDDFSKAMMGTPAPTSAPAPTQTQVAEVAPSPAFKPTAVEPEVPEIPQVQPTTPVAAPQDPAEQPARPANYVEKAQPEMIEENVVEGFFPSFKQSVKGTGQRLKYLSGEVSNLVTGSSDQYRKAGNLLDKVRSLGYTDDEISWILTSNPETLSYRLRDIDRQREQRGDTPIDFEEKNNLFPMSASAEDRQATISNLRNAWNQAGEASATTPGIKQSDAAKAVIGATEVLKKTWGDRIKEKAAEEINKEKPTKGFAAWAGAMVPQAVQTLIGIGLTAATRNPLPAKILGFANMAELTGSEMGGALKEARDYGASDADAWASSLLTGAVEYGTELIPFSRYFKRVSGGAKGKIIKDVIDNVQIPESAANEEMARLLKEGSKKLGGKFLTSKTAKDIALDLTAESASEFTAEALETMIPMIYQDPEDYPTLSAILKNGWEGAKGGLFLGALMGVPSTVVGHHQMNQRRKEQGFVDLGLVKKDGEDVSKWTVNEIVGKNDETGSLYVMTEDGSVEEIKPEDIAETHRYSYDEFREGVLQKELDNAYDNGQSLETPQEMHDAELMRESRANDIRELFGLAEDEDIDAFLNGNPGVAQNDEEQQMVDDYMKAKANEDGMIDKQRSLLDEEVNAVSEELNSRTNPDDGMIHPVVIKGSQNPHHVVSGAVVTFEDGTVDENSSSSEIIVVDDTTGEKTMMSPQMIESVGEVVDPTQELEVAKHDIYETKGKQMADAIDGVLPMNPGDQYTVLSSDGNLMTAIVGVNEMGLVGNGDGTINVSFDGGQTFAPVAAQELQAMSDAYNQARVDAFKAQQTIQQQEEAQEEAQPADAAAQTEEPGQVAEPMPMIGEGEEAEPDFMNVTPERAHQYIYEEAGLTREEAADFVKANIAEADKNLAKAKKNPPKIGTNIAKYKSEKAQYESLVGQMQGVVDYWNAIKAQQDAIVAAETQQSIAEREARQAEATEKAIIEEQARVAEVARKQEELEQLGANNVSPIVSEKWNAAQKIEGAPNELTLANGEKIQGKYYLVESGAASASHDANNGFVKTEGFPVDENGQSVNDRDYEHDADAQEITRRIASEYDNRAVQTPVIVSRDGVVLSGNGRTMAGELAAANNTDGAYIEYLTNYPQQFGFTPEQVSSMQHPRVVFVPDVDMPYNAETFAKFNQQEMKGQSKTETAVKLGKVVDDDTFKKIIRSINRFDRLADFYADNNATRAAIKLLNDAGVLSDVQMSEMFDADTISAHGKELLENMLIGKAFESNPNAVRQITTYKSVRQSIISALAEISNNIALGEEYSLENELSEAVDLVYKARQNGIKEGEAASSFARQGNLFQFDDGATAADYNNATVMMLADVLNDSRATYLRKILTLYNDNAADGAAGQQDLFIGSVETKDQILTSVQNIINYGTEAEQQAAIDNAVEQRKAEAESIQEDEPISTGDAGQQQREADAIAGSQPDVAPFTALSPKEGEDVLEYAERIVETEKRREEEAKTDTNPTEAQKEAGNYKKGHIKLDGYDITIENPKGSERSGVDENGNPWSITMNNTYGYIRRTEGVDGDHIDVFLSDDPDSGSVFVIDQVKPDGSFDEHKVMYGFNTAEEAREAYLSNYSEGWQGLGTITEVSKEEFKKWIESSHRKTKPFAEYKSVKAEGGQNEQKPAAAGYTIEKRYHKKNNTDIYAVKFTEKMDRDVFLSLKAKAKDFGGYYSSFGKGGFIFDTEADAKKFADDVTGNKEVSVPVSKVDVMGLMDQLSKTGEAKLSEHSQPIDTKTEVKEQPKKNEGAFGLVSDERMEELKSRLRKKLGGQMNVGIDPEILAIGIELAAGHIDRGVKSFSDFSKKMVTDLGDVIRPYLKAFYNGARDMPEVVEAGLNKGMTPYDEVSKFDVANFDKQAPDVMATADIITKEQNVQKQVKEIEDHEKQTEANTEIIASEGEALASEAASNAASYTEREANAVAEAIDKSVDKINEQLAILGYYEADTDDESKFHESYGYMKTAEVKAVKDVENFARKLARDLGIKLGRKRVSSANIAPAGGDVSFRLPLTDAKELYVWFRLNPNYNQGGFSDDLVVEKILYRIEDNSLQGHDKYGRNNWLKADVTYNDALYKIRKLIEREASEFNQQIDDTEKQQAKKSTSSKADNTSLFVDMFNNDNKTEDLHHGYKVGDKVWFTRNDGKNKREIATIYQFDEGADVTLDTGLAPIMYEAAKFNQIEPYKEQETKEKQPQNKKDNGLQRNDDVVRTERVPADDSRSGEGLSRSVEKDGEGTAERSERPDRGREREGSELDRDLQHGLHTVSGEKNSRNNRSERGVDHAPSSVDSRIKANIDAIKLSKQLIENDETATDQQMEVLRKFSGWGGLGKAFSDSIYSNQLKQLLGAEAYQEAIKSANSGYYTPAVVIDTLWDIAKKLGFKGGNILEGSAGIGNILGQIPEEVSKNSDIQAVEYDSTTGGILSLLYPDAEVNIQGFEQTRIPNGSVDLAITNVPFVTGLRVRDTSGDQDLAKKFHNIHDFCIAKNVRKLREGGLGIFITSNGTLDNSKQLRDWVTNEGKSDFIGAFRMHNKTFIGAPVTSDIIVVRKRVNGVKSPYAIDLSDVSGERVAEYDTGDTRKVKGIEEPIVKRVSMDYNKYFMEHPENMAGEMKFGFEEGDTYRPTSKGLYPVANKNQDQMLSDFVNSFKRDDENIAETPGNKEDSKFVLDASSDGKKLGEMYIKDGQLVTASLGGYYPLNLNNNKVKGHTKEECFESYAKIKDALNKVLDYQTENEGNEGLQPLLDNLNKAYDSFVKTYGHFNGNRSISFLRNDVDYPNVFSLEIYKKVEDKPGHVVDKFEKTDVFKKRVVEKEVEPNPKNIKDGIVASIFKYSRINIPYIAEHLGKSEKEVKDQIINSGLGFEDPVDRQIEVSFKYLSGNVREKLRQAQENNVDGVYNSNIKALQDVLPISIPAHLIDFTLGSSWLSPKLYDEYVKDRTGIDVKFKAVGGTWFMAAPDYGLSKEKNKSFGVISRELNSTIYGHTLIEAAIQNKSITVSKTRRKWDGTTETIIDKEATQACANKIDEIRQDFKEWARQKMQASPEMSAEMERVYNDTFNNYVPMSIPSEFVPEYFAGATHQIKMKEHQGKAIVRGTMQPLLLAHEVGTGKTFTLISTAMEMRRLGTARKPMVVVQNATVGQFVSSAKTLYPNARILTLEDTDRSAEGRRNFYAKIKYNDWDMIVVPQSTFEFIPDSEERQMAFIQDKIEEKMRVLDQMKEDDPNGNSIISRQAEREIDQLKDELANLAEETSKKHDERSVASQKKREVSRQNAQVSAQEMLDRRTDDVENFDDMGIDALLVDEAHEYKHLGFATAMQRGVKGVDPSYSKKSQGVYLKTQAVLEKNNGRNVVFATGTPISNTAAEIWTFMRYLMPADTMREYGIYYFDDFVRNFGNIQQMLEFTTSGKFKENNRFAGYVNLPELIRIWSSVSDTVLTKEAAGVNDKIPDIEGGKAQDIYLPQTKALRSIMKYVKSELERFDKMSGKEKKENSHIPLTMYGIAKAAAVDARLVQSDAEDDPQSKTNEAVRQTLRSLKETDDYKGTVAIFADNYKNNQSGFNLYEDIKNKLVDNGVPADKIVVMKPGMTIKKKLEIFDKLNSGDIRVILGSTFTAGTGVNIHERLHTLIHLDAPNRPMDYTQRNGRILRQGNLHKQWGKPVRILRFGVEDSLDVTAYQRLKTKGAISESIMSGKTMMANSMNNRVLEEEEDLFGDTVAQLSGSEYAMLKNNAEKNVRKYESRKKQWEADQTYIHSAKPKFKGLIAKSEEIISENQEYLKLVKSIFKDGKFNEITIGKNRFANTEDMADFIKDYNKSILNEVNKLKENAGYDNQVRDLVIDVDGLKFKVSTGIYKDVESKNGSLFTETHRIMTYSCPELGIDNTPVYQSLLRNAIEDIVSNVITGNDFQERIDAAERSIKYNQSELEQLESREGKPFEYEDELNKAKKQYIEYSELMRKEMEEKEAKYAKMDSDIKEADNISNTEEDEEEAVRFRMMDDLNPDMSVENVKYEINKLAESLGVDIRIVEDIDDIVDNNKQTQKMMRNAYGWFDPNTQDVVIVLPNVTSMDNAKATVLHEIVGHKGLQALLGDHFTTFLSKVYNGASVKTKARINAMMERRGLSKRVATEEYIAELAEEGFNDRESRNMWQKIKDFFMDMLRAAKINIGFEVNDNDLRYMLWRTYQMQRNKGVMGEAENIAMQQELGVGNYDNDTKYSVKSDRDAMIEESKRIREQVKNQMEELKKRADNIEITFDNFFINTRGTFELTDTPKREPDYTSERRDGSGISSRYWYGTDEGGAYVIRESDHWSGYLYGSNNPDWQERNMQNQTPIASCRWALRMPNINDYNSGWQTGKIYLKDLSVADKTNESLIEDMEKGEKPIRYSLKREIMPGESLMDFADRIVEEQKTKHKSDNENRLAQLREVNRKIMDLVKEFKDEPSNSRLGFNSYRGVRSAASTQRKYDLATVKQLSDLVNTMIENKLLDDMTQGEVKRLMSAVKNGTSRKDIMPSVNKIFDIVASNQIRAGKELLHKVTTIKASKVNASGVEVRGKLDLTGQKTVKTFKEAMGLSIEEVTERMDDLQDKLADPNNIVANNAAIEYNALNLAKMYIETIKDSEADERFLRNKMNDAIEQYKEGYKSEEERKANIQYIKTIYDAIRHNKMTRVGDYHNLIGKLVELESESIEKAKELKQKEVARIKEIHHNANSDMKGIPTDEHIKETSWMKNWRQNVVLRFLLEPMASWDQMLRYFGRKDVHGEGYLFNRFFRNGVMKAVDNEYIGMKEAMERLDQKAAEVYGKKGMLWSDLYNKERGNSDIQVTMINGGQKETVTLTQGNALYIYMVNKMDDGKMKLRNMGITEEQVDRIANELDPKFIALADWVQEELLPDLRNKYNEVYERMFGAPMGEIENYFPLKILSNARVQEEDVSKPENSDSMPSTITGSIIKRKRNSAALDLLNTDAFSLVIEHIQQMEHWAAFAEYNRDVNTLLSYKHFRNQVQNMKSVEFGSGAELWKQFKKTAQLASETYTPKPAKFDRLAANLMKGIAGSKIAFRAYTAAKQVLSYPVFATDANFAALLKNTARPDLAWKWCIENLPQFEKRWKGRQSGDTRLMQTNQDWDLWKNETIKKIRYWGMTPNAFVDAVVVAMGAKSVYDTSYPKYIEMGFSEEEADKRAKEDAVISFNETQQSNEGAYVSPMQQDRNLISGAFSLYRNSSMLFQRRYFAALRGLSKKFRSDYKEESIEFMTKQYTRQGLPEQQARKAAERRYSRSWFKDAADVAMFGFLAQFIWNLGAGAAYILLGDDDDEKKKFVLDAARHATLGGLEGLAGGNYLSEGIDAALRGEFKNFNPSLHPGLSDLELIKNHLVSDQVQALNDIINITISAYSGVNPKTVTDAALAIWDICDNDVKTAKEASMFIMRILNAPQSQLDKIYIDELKMTAKEARKYTPEELAERYVDYKAKRESALTGWAYTEGEEAEAKKKYRNRFKDQAKERLMIAGDKAINKQYDEYMEKYYKPIAEKVAQAKALANGDEYKEDDLLYEIEQEDPDAYYIYQILADSKKELDKLATDWFKSITTQDMDFYELDVADEKMYAVKDVQSIMESNK